MSLDQHLTRKTLVTCPCCNTKIPVATIDDTVDICYWHNDRELHSYINDNIHTYSDEEYGKNVKLSASDMRKIYKFLKDRDGGYINSWCRASGDLPQAILDAENESAEFYYSADW